MDVSPLSHTVTASFELDFSYAYGSPALTGVFRAELEDFIVTEEFPVETLAGEGEHHCFRIEKRNQNTRWVAKLLAEYFQVSEVAIGYCGLKDRRAITRQWFSVHVPARKTVEMPNPGEGIDVLEYRKHTKKLRRGDHAGNRFSIRLRNLGPDIRNRRAQLISKLGTIQQFGVPNYFGEQRFGIQGNNLQEADKLLRGIRERQTQSQPRRRKRDRQTQSSRKGLYLSAARSYLFNQVLSARIQRFGWQSLDSGSTGPLWGRGRSPVEEAQRALENDILKDWQHWLVPLEFSGLAQERRPLVLIPHHMQYDFEGDDLLLDFTLAPGQFATSVLREIVAGNRTNVNAMADPGNSNPVI